MYTDILHSEPDMFTLWHIGGNSFFQAEILVDKAMDKALGATLDTPLDVTLDRAGAEGGGGKGEWVERTRTLLEEVGRKEEWVDGTSTLLRRAIGLFKQCLKGSPSHPAVQLRAAKCLCVLGYDEEECAPLYPFSRSVCHVVATLTFTLINDILHLE